MKMILVTLIAMLVEAAAAQPSSTFLPTFSAQGISADGRVVVGADGPSAAYWTPTVGIVPMTTPHADTEASSLAVGASADGSVITGCSLNEFGIILLSWVWTRQGSTVLQAPGAASTRSTCISADGQTVGGIAIPAGGAYQSFVWTAADGFRLIPWGTNYQTWLHGLSANGLKGAGSGSSAIGTWPTYWGSTYVWCQNIGPVPGQASGFAFGISGDGSTLVGHFGAATDGPAFVWSAEDGYTLVGTRATLETASYDGRIAGGVSHEGLIDGGLVCVRGAGSFSAQAYFASHGLNTSSVGEIVGMSANGRVFVSRTYGVASVVWNLGPCGSADFDHDGNPGTDADIEAFFRCLAGDCCPLCDSADFNYDGDAGTDADIEAFFRVLAGGSC